jgi:tetratricopeptide (TPR) repeat protein
LQTSAENAKNAYDQGDFPRAARLFEDAENEARQANDALTGAEMANNRSVALLKAGDAQGALDACLGSEQVFSQAGERTKEAMAWGNQAAAYEALGKLDKAMELYQQCAALLKETGEKELRSYVLKTISALQLRRGEQLQSMATMQAALDLQKKSTLVERILKKLLKIPFKMLR